MTTADKSKDTAARQSLYQRMISGRYGLAITYWTLFLTGAVLFFIFGSLAVLDREWGRFLVLLAASVLYSLALLVGVSRSYQGADPGKALGRITVLFLLLNLTNTLAVLSFI